MTHSVTFYDPLSAEDKALMAFMQGGTPGTPGTGTADYFPADPALAPFPSPENSQILVTHPTSGAPTIGGRPYLKDQDGAVHTIKLATTGTPEYYKNGQLFANWPGEAVAQCLVRQGEVYMQIASGIWKRVDPNGSMYNRLLPPAWTTSGGGGTPGLPALPDLPVPAAIAPGSSNRIIHCGVGQTLTTLSAAIPTAQAGDTILVSPGTYTDTPPVWTVPLLIDLGGATFNAVGKTATLARGKALLCPAADSIIQNGTIINVAMDQAQGELTSAIRPDVGCGYLTIKKIKAVNNQCAVGHGGFPVVIALDGCDISNNGLKANTGSLTHDLYVGQECRRLTLTSVIANGANEAHAIKYRGPELIVNGGTFASNPGKPFDIPNGSTVPFKITGATIIKNAPDADHGILAYGEEGATNGLAGGSINGGSIRADCQNPTITTAGGTITVTSTLSGNKIAPTGGGIVTGI
jgi:hypothetical protein